MIDREDGLILPAKHDLTSIFHQLSVTSSERGNA